MCSNSTETGRIPATVCALRGILPSGIQPLAVCQSMDHGRTVQAVTTDTFFFQKMCPGLKSNLV